MSGVNTKVGAGSNGQLHVERESRQRGQPLGLGWAGVDLLAEAGRRFRSYEDQHRAKLGPWQSIVDADASRRSVAAARRAIADTTAKAEANAEIAGRIEVHVLHLAEAKHREAQRLPQNSVQRLRAEAELEQLQQVMQPVRVPDRAAAPDWMATTLAEPTVIEAMAKVQAGREGAVWDDLTQGEREGFRTVVQQRAAAARL